MPLSWLSLDLSKEAVEAHVERSLEREVFPESTCPRMQMLALGGEQTCCGMRAGEGEEEKEVRDDIRQGKRGKEVFRVGRSRDPIGREGDEEGEVLVVVLD